MEELKKFAVAITIAKIDNGKVDTNFIASQLYIVTSTSKDTALGFTMQHSDIKTALSEQGYVVTHTNVAEIY